MPKRILVLLGHPDSNTLCGELADSYARAASIEGHEVRQLRLGDLRFDPVLRHGYGKDLQALEPDLASAQEAITWAQHLVFVYPIWWGAMPALLKGFIDRTFVPAFAFKYRSDSPKWDKLLVGRSADLLVTMDAPPWYFRWIQRMPGHVQMKNAILEFCGIAPVRVYSFGPVRHASLRRRKLWIEKAMALARKV